MIRVTGIGLCLSFVVLLSSCSLKGEKQKKAEEFQELIREKLSLTEKIIGLLESIQTKQDFARAEKETFELLKELKVIQDKLETIQEPTHESMEPFRREYLIRMSKANRRMQAVKEKINKIPGSVEFKQNFKDKLRELGV